MKKPQTVYLYDVSPLLEVDLHDPAAIRRMWDEFHLVVSLQGLVNRTGPRLYLRCNQRIDDFWLEQMQAPGAWMEHARISVIDGLEELLDFFSNEYEGAVIYDERVPATSLLASTIAGAENLLCVRHDESAGSLCQRLVQGEGRLKERVRLLNDDGGIMFTGRGIIPGTDVPSTGSPKNDAYRWLLHRYIQTGRINPDTIGYYIDAFWLKCGHIGQPVNHTLTNHDYIIARKGFFFDLGVWDDEAPVDEPDSPPGLDVETLELLLDAANVQLEHKKLIHVAGYVPWLYKYTNVQVGGWNAGSKYGGVPAEWKCTEILTAYNAYLDADALSCSSMVNASFFMHYPLPDRIPQSDPPSLTDLQERGLIDEEGRVVPRTYYAHYVGDYDAAAWLYWYLPDFWPDSARGKLPLSWAFNPNLAERFPFGLHWARTGATPNDRFVAGDSGAGYVNPRNLSEPRPYSGYFSAMALWEEHCRRHMEQWDLSIVGFVLDGNTENMTDEGWDAYSRFAPDGIVFHRYAGPPGVYKGMPYMTMLGDLPRAEASKAAARLHEHLVDGETRLLCFRSVVMPPSWYLQIEEELDLLGRGDAMLVDMATLLRLVAVEHGVPQSTG